jgi:RNA polymerase sigma-70 factor (ECF subfamily)
MTKEEFENIYRQHYAKMYRLARTMLYDADESKDVVSDIFARLLRERLRAGERQRVLALPATKGRAGASAGMKYHPQQNQMEGYLMTAVRNRCRDILSHKSMRERVEKLFLQESEQSHIVSMNDDDRLERLMQFIEAELPPLSQQIFRLRFLREMSYEEVAQATGVSKVTVYNHLSQSLQRIREYFDQETAKR